jgi:hypothetical protein
MLKPVFIPYSEKLRQATQRRLATKEYIELILLNKNRKKKFFFNLQII